MSCEVDLTDATVNILIELDGNVHLVAMTETNFKMFSSLIKTSAEGLIKTGKTQVELLEFLNYKE